MKTYYFKYTMPDAFGLPMDGTLNLRRESPVSNENAIRKVAKEFSVSPAQVTINSREVWEGTLGFKKNNLTLVESWAAPKS